LAADALFDAAIPELRLPPPIAQTWRGAVRAGCARPDSVSLAVGLSKLGASFH